MVDIVGRGAGRLLRLVEDLLELAGLESGRLTPDLALLDLPDVIAAAAESHQHAAGLTFTLDVESGPPVRADAARITRLVRGLRAHAEQHTPGTGAEGQPGSGLGLAIGRTVAELHGGTLTLVSTEGAGTTVTLRLPYAYGSPS